MCGRFVRHSPLRTLSAFTGAAPAGDEPPPRYNLAPGQVTAAVIQRGNERHWTTMRWGLVPHWARDPAIGQRLINARAETLADKPSFRDAFARRRCLIPADGFYEWRKQGRISQPWYIHRRDQRPLAFAGLWENWHGPEGTLTTCVIVTTEANEVLAPIHNRMPVILESTDFHLWLDPASTDPLVLGKLLRPYPAALLQAVPVSERVNHTDHDDPTLLTPVSSGDLFD